MATLARTESPARPYYIQVYFPGSGTDHLSINYPEHFATSQGMLMHHRADIETPYRQTKPVKWQIGREGTEAGYECEFENGLAFSVQLTVKENEVVQRLRMRNGSDKPINNMRPTLCTLLGSWREFQNRDDHMAHYDRSFTVTGGTAVSARQLWDAMPAATKQRGEGRVWMGCNVKGQMYKNRQWYIVDRECDAGFIAVRSKERKRYVALFWPKCRLVFTNTNVPCIHADPELPDCPPGEEVSLTGKIIFHEGGLESLLTRLQIGEPR